MGKYWENFKTICKHRSIVYRECKACGIGWQGLIHDLSKFSMAEFVPYAKHHHGTTESDRSPRADFEYRAAWMHHKGRNPHHWEYWIDYDKDGTIIAYKMPFKYVVEAVCDWVGAGIVYEKEAWTQEEPLEYFNKVRSGRYLNKETENLMLFLLNSIKCQGLKGLHWWSQSEVLRDTYERGGEICVQKYMYLWQF